MADYAYDDLAIKVRRDDTTELYTFGVELDGAFIPLYAVSSGHVDPRIADAPKPAPKPKPKPKPKT
jgi:hypothetical protein